MCRSSPLTSTSRVAVGPEAAARQARYRALDAEARARAATVLLGHTLDDQAETVLLGLARGSGSRSLAGMVPRAGHLVRPFLQIRRTTTEQVCAELGLEPWQDPHNSDRRFTRVRVRDTVLPTLEAELGPGVAEAWRRTAELVRDDNELLDQLAAADVPHRRRAGRDGHPRLRRPGIPTSGACAAGSFGCGCWLTGLATSHCGTSARWSLW